MTIGLLAGLYFHGSFDGLGAVISGHISNILKIVTHSLEYANLTPINTALLSPSTAVDTLQTINNQLMVNRPEDVTEFVAHYYFQHHQYVRNYFYYNQEMMRDWYSLGTELPQFILQPLTSSVEIDTQTVQSSVSLVDSSIQATSNLTDMAVQAAQSNSEIAIQAVTHSDTLRTILGIF